MRRAPQRPTAPRKAANPWNNPDDRYTTISMTIAEIQVSTRKRVTLSRFEEPAWRRSRRPFSVRLKVIRLGRLSWLIGVSGKPRLLLSVMTRLPRLRLLPLRVQW